MTFDKFGESVDGRPCPSSSTRRLLPAFRRALELLVGFNFGRIFSRAIYRSHRSRNLHRLSRQTVHLSSFLYYSHVRHDHVRFDRH